MKVSELIKLLQKLPQDLEVIRGAGDWGVIKVSEARQAVFHAQSSDECYFWETYDPECPREEYETPNQDMVIIE